MDVDAASSDSERLLVLLSYGLFLIAPPMGGITALIGVIIAHVRLSHAAGGFCESHYRNLIRVFWTMLLFALGLMTLLTFAMGSALATLPWVLPPLRFSYYPWPFWPAAMTGLGWAMMLPVLGLLSLCLAIWYYWRLLRGFVRALDDKPY
jgi:uncharacterized membrane protein